MDPVAKPAPDRPAALHQFAAFLDARRGALMEVWKAALRRNQRAGQVPDVDEAGLIDHLPRLFDDLVADLRGEQRALEQTARDATQHGQTRWDQHYSLSEVLRELGIVSRLLFEHGFDAFADVHAELDREALRPARATILNFFEDTASGSAQQYVRRQQEKTDEAHEDGRQEERQRAALVQNDYDRLAGLFQRSPSFLAVLRGPDHVFHLANDQYQRICGHRELIGKPVREALPEVVSQGYVELLDRVYTTGEPFTGTDMRVLVQSEPDAPPREHFIDFVYVPTRREDGTVDGILVDGVDWTERKRAERAVAELSELRRLALDSAQMGTWHLDFVTQQIQWDDQCKAVFGVADEEPSLERVLTLLHPDDREQVRAALTDASRPVDPVPYAIEYRVARPDGSWRWVQAHGKTYYEGDGTRRRAIKLVGTVRDITGSKRAQEALRNSEAKYRSLFDSIDQAFAVLDIIRDEADRPVDYRFVEVNPAMERHTGWQDARGRTARELISNLEDHWPETYGRVERTGEPIRFVQRAEGMGRIFDAYAFRIGSADRPQVAILFQDVTEQRATAARLAQLSEQRRLALDSAQLGWWHYDPATKTVDWDERTRAFYGLDGKHVAYEEFIVTIHPDDLPARDAAFQAALRPDNPQYEAEYRVKHADGSWRWLQIKGRATSVGEGAQRHVVSMDGTVADVTLVKTAQEALRESEAKFRQLADSMPQIVWAARPDGVLDYTNRRWYEFIQKDEAEWDVANWGERVHPEDLTRVVPVWQASIGNGEPYAAEFRVQRGDGEYRWFLVRALPVRDGEGRITRWFGTCTDIQDQRVLMEQNRQLLESERTARTQAERTSQMKDEFLATLSHELRTPLNAILGWSQVLRDDPSHNEDTAAGLATIERNAKAQTQIIEDLLDMSKIISGKVRLDVQPLHLDQVVAAAVDTMRPAATAKGIRLQTVIDPQARMISGDPNRLQQVFWNLLTNAIKFTPKGGQVQVVLERVNSHLEVCVADTGEGIAPEFLPHVFDRFRQQDASTTRKHGGLGLGLAIVKQLVELHGGNVKVESRGAGHGTTFCVHLPLSVVQPAREEDDQGRRHPQSEVNALSLPTEWLDLAGVKVLVVDDEADARALVKRLLEDRKAIVHTAGSAAEALVILQAERPDVLVSDIGMPEEDGYTLIRRVRALKAEEGGATPAVALTAYARAEDRLKAILAGFEIHVSKPVNTVELLALVAKLAGRTGSF